MRECDSAQAPDNLSEKEWVFVRTVCNYKFPAVTDLTEIRKDNPDKEILFEDYIKGKERTERLILSLSLATEEKSINVRGIIDSVKKNGEYKNLVRLSYEWVCLWGMADDLIVSPRIRKLVELCKYIVKTWISNNRRTSQSYSFVGIRDSAYTMKKTSIQAASNIFLTVLKNEDIVVNHVLQEKYGDISETYIDVT